MRQKQSCQWIAWIVFLPVIVWAGFLLAPCAGGNLLDFFGRMTEALQSPFTITLCENSGRTVILFLLIYGIGITVYYSTQKNFREGEEHGSAKWGTPRQLNSVLEQKENFLLTKRVRLGMDTHKHRRNLNTLVLGGSGAGKTRFLALPNIMEANCSYVITDPNDYNYYDDKKLRSIRHKQQ